MESRTLRADRVQLFAESFGSPAEPAILLIMGAAASAVWWPRPFCEALAARGRHVVRYDHRDTGRSTHGAPGRIDYSVEDLADDAVAVLDGYGHARAHLAGMSLGGYLAQLLALKHPHRVLSLTLIASEPLGPGDPSIPGIDPRVLAHHASGAGLDWSDRDAVIRFGVEGWRLLGGSARRFDEDGTRALAAEDLERTGDLRLPLNHALLAGGERWFGRLGEIRVPSLVIHGTDDPVLRFAHGLALARMLPRAKLLPLAGAGHELHPDDWPAMLDAIERHTASSG